MRFGDRALPSGMVTMLFTDVEGSTRLLDGLGPERYAAALLDHRERLRAVAEAHGGVEVGTEGDAFLFVFQGAGDGLAAAGEMQAAIARGPLRVRMGIHSGEVLLADGDYVGMTVHKAARICSAAHGGQVVASDQTRALAGVALRDLGEHRLKDLTAPERLFQLGKEDFPPLRTLRQVNLPVQATPLIGRERELAELVELAGSHRVITLTGTGGTGKTRLALALAAELADSYVDGVWWVRLASVTDPGLVSAGIAAALGAIEDLPTYLSGRALLLVIDNLEQVIDSAPRRSAGCCRVREIARRSSPAVSGSRLRANRSTPSRRCHGTTPWSCSPFARARSSRGSSRGRRSRRSASVSTGSRSRSNSPQRASSCSQSTSSSSGWSSDSHSWRAADAACPNARARCGRRLPGATTC